jgi:hypothetical protein
MRCVALDRIRWPSGVPCFTALWSLLVPGLGIYLRGHRFWGKIAMLACAGLILIFLAGLGTFAGNAAFGMLVSIHVTSVLYAYEPWLIGERLLIRLLFSVCVLFLLGRACYMPMRDYVQEHWLMPLSVKGQVVIVYRQASGQRLKRGAWIAYSYHGNGQRGVVVQDGIGLSPVLALPGDQVRFGAAAFEVNGVPHPNLPHMPQTGQWVVPEKHWFVWPEVAIGGHGAVAPQAITTSMLEMGTITDSQIMGRPFKRWLWRRQLGS